MDMATPKGGGFLHPSKGRSGSASAKAEKGLRQNRHHLKKPKPDLAIWFPFWFFDESDGNVFQILQKTPS
jgi:hypothetical protein